MGAYIPAVVVGLVVLMLVGLILLVLALDSIDPRGIVSSVVQTIWATSLVTACIVSLGALFLVYELSSHAPPPYVLVEGQCPADTNGTIRAPSGTPVGVPVHEPVCREGAQTEPSDVQTDAEALPLNPSVSLPVSTRPNTIAR
jgi:hypothetical protein